MGALALALILVALPVSGSQFAFDPSRGLVELEATINGYMVGRFGIDTGADKFYLDRAFAKRARVAVTESDRGSVVRGIDGSSSVGKATLRSLDIQGERIYNVPVDIIDLSALTGGKWQAPDGLIGFPVLRRFYVTVDYPKQTLELYSHEKNYESDEVFGVPFTLQGYLIVVNVTIDGSAPLRFILDYCASMTILTPEALSRIGLKGNVNEYQVATEIKIVEVDESATPNVTFYIKSLNELGESSNFAGIDGILGYSFLASHKITVDYLREVLLFHR